MHRSFTCVVAGDGVRLDCVDCSFRNRPTLTRWLCEKTMFKWMNPVTQLTYQMLRLV